MSCRYFGWIVFVSLSVAGGYAQEEHQTWEDRQRGKNSFRSAQEDSLTVAPEAMRQILHLFEPQSVEMEDDPLTVEQLHEWVGEPEEVLSPDTVVHSRYDSIYFALKLYERELGTVQDLPGIRIPGGNDVSYRAYTPRPTVSFDSNHLLSMMMSKEYRTIRRLRAVKEAHRHLYGELY